MAKRTYGDDGPRKGQDHGNSERSGFSDREANKERARRRRQKENERRRRRHFDEEDFEEEE